GGAVRLHGADEILLVENIESDRKSVAQEVGIGHSNIEAMRVLAESHGGLAEDTGTEQVPLTDRDLSKRSVRGRIAAGNIEVSGLLLLDRDVDKDSIRDRAGFVGDLDRLEQAEILEPFFRPVE